jgi:hypothetical protein
MGWIALWQSSLENAMKLKPSIGALLLVLAIGFVSAGCGGGGGNSQDALFQPQVVSTYPTNGATSVPTNFATPGTSVITATFNKPMNPASINARTFYAISSAGELAGVVTYSNQVATLTLNAAMPQNTVITATITVDSAQAGQGHPTVGQTYVWSFTSGANNS